MKALPPLVVGLGRVELQFISLLPSLPEGDRSVEVDSISIQVGGSGAVAIGTATQLGCRGRFACKLAEDFAGNFILDALRAAGIETRGVLAQDKKLSALRFTALEREPRRELSFFSRGDAGALGESEVNVERLLSGAAALLIDGFAPDVQRKVAAGARERDIPVIFDCSEVTEANRDAVDGLVGQADILIASERGVAELSRTDNLERSLRQLSRRGPSAVVVTMGEAGAIGFHQQGILRQPAFPADVVDATGAGAVFHGAFCAALLSHLPFARCLEFAAAAASLSCHQIGAWAGIPGRNDVLELLRARPG